MQVVTRTLDLPQRAERWFGHFRSAYSPELGRLLHLEVAQPLHQEISVGSRDIPPMTMKS